MRCVLVTGCGGFIGSHVCEWLLRDGHEVIGVQAVSRQETLGRTMKNLHAISTTAERLQGRFTLVRRSVTDPDMLAHCRKVGGDFGTIIHLAARAGVRDSLSDPLEYTRVNILGLQTLLLSLPACVEQFVFASSSSVYGQHEGPAQEACMAATPLSPYAMTKMAGELCLRQHHALTGLSTSLLRFFSVYGPRQRADLVLTKFTEHLLAGRTLTIYGNGTSRRDYTAVEDIVDGILRSMAYMDCDGRGRCEAFNLGSGAPVGLHTLLGLLAAALFPGTPIDALWEKETVRYVARQASDPEETHADGEKSRRLLGYTPLMPLMIGVQRFVDWRRHCEEDGQW